VILFIGTLAISGFAESNVSFNANGAKSLVAKEIFGVLMERLGAQWSINRGPAPGTIFVGTNSSIPNINGMRKDVIEAFKECGVGAIEWPGGCAANSYDWDAENKRNDVGVDRFIEFCKQTGAEAVIAGMHSKDIDYAASNEAFAKHIIEKLNYPLKYFKVGNEVWGCGGNLGSDVNKYIPRYTSSYNRLKELRNHPNGKDLKIIACNDIEGKWAWLPAMLNAIGNTIDGVEYHDYLYFPDPPGGVSSANPNETDYWKVIGAATANDFRPNVLNRVIPPMNTYDPNKRIKLILDEWGDWLIDVGDGWMQQGILMDAISAGIHLNIMIQNADRIGVACLAQGVNVIHSLVNINNGGTMVKTPTFYVFKMYIPHHTNNAKFLPLTSSPTYEKTNNLNAVDVAATVDDSGIVNISFVNIDLNATRDVKVTLSGDNRYLFKSAEVVTGSSYKSYNPFGQAEQVNIQTLPASNCKVNGNVVEVKLPSKCVAMVRLKPEPKNGVSKMHLSGTINDIANAFSVKSGANGSIIVSSSVSMETPVLLSLYSADGKTLIESSKSLNAGSCILGNNIGKGIYFVKITGNNLNLTKQIVVGK